MKSISNLVFFILFSSTLVAQEEIKLYSTGPKVKNELQKAESFRDKEFIVDISEARMFAFPVSDEHATGTAVLICPGGGYAGISQIKEGSDIANWFNKLGITAFVLYYRMPNSHSIIPLTDAQMALKIIRKRSKEWNIDKNKIGIMGFSAGGHLASTVGTHFKNTKQRPAFMILGYPVVTMNKEITHGGSRNNLLGAQPSDELIKQYSNELQVTKKTPPTFLVHAIDDKAVPIANSEQFFKALQNNNVPAEFHKYDVGGHGFGMRSRGIPVDNWPELLKVWLKTNKLTN